ncbi:MAG: GvpL/GvpF family gas vesicle protein [Bacteroidota bacterium]
MSGLIYVYCIAKSIPTVEPSTLSGNLEYLAIDDCVVIAKYVSDEEFSEENLKINISDVIWLEKNAREHIRIISQIMNLCDVIPLRLGTIFLSEDSLRNFISDYAGSFRENFQFIGGKEEWAVKIFCDRKLLGNQIDELSHTMADMETQIKASSPGKAFLLRRKKTDLVEIEIDNLCRTFGQEYFEALKVVSDETCLNNLLPKEFTGRTDTMILNATFLVSQNNVSTFIEKLDVIRKRDRDSVFFIEESGPWPAFSFVTIKEK